MTPTTTGALLGAVLALTWVVLGFWAFIFVALAMTIGALTVRVLDGRLDLRRVAAAFSGKRSA